MYILRKISKESRAKIITEKERDDGINGKEVGNDEMRIAF